MESATAHGRKQLVIFSVSVSVSVSVSLSLVFRLWGTVVSPLLAPRLPQVHTHARARTRTPPPPLPLPPPPHHHRHRPASTRAHVHTSTATRSHLATLLHEHGNTCAPCGLHPLPSQLWTRPPKSSSPGPERVQPCAQCHAVAVRGHRRAAAPGRLPQLALTSRGVGCGSLRRDRERVCVCSCAVVRRWDARRMLCSGLTGSP